MARVSGLFFDRDGPSSIVTDLRSLVASGELHGFDPKAYLVEVPSTCRARSLVQRVRGLSSVNLLRW